MAKIWTTTVIVLPVDTMCESMNVDIFEVPVAVYDFDDLDSALNQIDEKGALDRVGGAVTS